MSYLQDFSGLLLHFLFFLLLSEGDLLQVCSQLLHLLLLQTQLPCLSLRQLLGQNCLTHAGGGGGGRNARLRLKKIMKIDKTKYWSRYLDYNQ